MGAPSDSGTPSGQHPESAKPVDGGGALRHGDRGARWLAAIAGAMGGGTLLALVDAASLGARLRWSLPIGRLLALTITAGATAGLLAGVIAAPLGMTLRRRPRLAVAVVALGGVATCAAFAVDLLVLPHLYPEAHRLAGMVALIAAATMGAALLPARFAPWLLVPGLALAISGSWIGPKILEGNLRLREAVLDRSTLLARAVQFWPPPDSTDARTACVAEAPRALGPAVAPPLAPHAAVLLLTIDAMRGDLGGERLAATLPRTVAQLRHAVRFDRAYTAATRTTESLYGVFTGRLPQRLDFRPAIVDQSDAFHELPPQAPALYDPRTWKQRQMVPMHDTSPTLAALLGEAGYATAAVIPYVLLLPASGVTRGFGTVDDAPYRERNHDNDGITADVSTREALDFLAATTAHADRPFFLWAHYMDPHAPYLPYHASSAAPEQARYLGELARVDDSIGALLETLAHDGRLDRMVVVITADHGEAFGEHGGSFHGTSVYEEQLRVPLLVQVPGGVARVERRPVSLLDLAPTILDAVGVRPAARFDGRSLVDALRGVELAPRTVTGVATLHGLRVGIVDGDSKYVEDLVTGTREVYQLDVDPGEHDNLVDARPDLAAIGHCRAALLGLERGPFGGSATEVR